MLRGLATVSFFADDLPATLERLQAMGAQEYEPLTEREAGFRTASVADPFGNILGVMHNPHYLEIVNGRAGAA